MSQVISRREARTLQDSYKNSSTNREAVFNFGMKGLVGEKRFEDFNDFDRNVM